MGDLWLDSLSLPPELTPTPDSVSPKPYQQVERYLAWEEDRVPSYGGRPLQHTRQKKVDGRMYKQPDGHAHSREAPDRQTGGTGAVSLTSAAALCSMDFNSLRARDSWSRHRETRMRSEDFWKSVTSHKEAIFATLTRKSGHT